jgi:enamine deaminase RidA (YjgF/YER057c/UK114 family)
MGRQGAMVGGVAATCEGTYVVKIERRLAEMGLQLPEPLLPKETYVAWVQVGDLLFLSGVANRVDGVLTCQGKVGREVTVEQGYAAARVCALNHLALIKAALGDLDRVERIVKVVVHVNSAPGFNQQPRVANGESDLLVELYGERGRHCRLALGAAELSSDTVVASEMIVQVRPEEHPPET